MLELGVVAKAVKILVDLRDLRKSASPGQRNRRLLAVFHSIYADLANWEVVGFRPMKAFTSSCKQPTTEKTQKRGPLIVGDLHGNGGDGGESHSPSRNFPNRICYKRVRRFDLVGSGSRRRDPVSTSRKNYGRYAIGVARVASRNNCTSASQLPGLPVADVAATRRLERIHVRQLLVCHCFNEGSSNLGLQSVRKHPCRTYASPLLNQKRNQAISPFKVTTGRAFRQITSAAHKYPVGHCEEHSQVFGRSGDLAA